MQGTHRGAAFPVTDAHGGDYVLYPLYKSGERRDDTGGSAFLPRTFAAAECVGLVTGDGRSAERTAKGRYRLLAGGPDAAGAGAELYSDDPDAP